MSEDSRFLGSLYGHGSGYAGAVWDINSTAPTLNTMQGGGRQPHMVEVIKLQQDADTKCLRMVRTEEGKRLRKAYESGEIHHGFNDHREPEPREDGMCNTLTTVSKDNYLLEVKQATQKGYVSCEIGGGSRLKLPGFNNPERKGDKKRNNLSNSDDGEYP